MDETLPGVDWSITGKWAANIRIGGKRKYLGIFMNEVDAGDAYRKAVKSLGEDIL